MTCLCCWLFVCQEKQKLTPSIFISTHMKTNSGKFSAYLLNFHLLSICWRCGKTMGKEREENLSNVERGDIEDNDLLMLSHSFMHSWFSWINPFSIILDPWHIQTNILTHIFISTIWFQFFYPLPEKVQWLKRNYKIIQLFAFKVQFDLSFYSRWLHLLIEEGIYRNRSGWKFSRRADSEKCAKEREIFIQEIKFHSAFIAFLISLWYIWIREKKRSFFNKDSMCY